MGIRDLLIEVAKTYDSSGKAERGKPGHDLLRAAGDMLKGSLPYGMVAAGHGGLSNAAITPWVGLHFPTASKSGTSGLYLAYIFAADLRTVTLTLQQGVTDIKEGLKEQQGGPLGSYLEARTQALRKTLPPGVLEGWLHRPDFGDRRWRPRSYERASVAAKEYEIARMPQESDLCGDIARLADILRLTEKGERYIHDDFSAAAPTLVLASHYGHSLVEGPDFEGLEGFRPKNAAQYIAQIAARQQIKNRDHERLIADFGPHALERGFTPITEAVHPRDAILRKGGEEWIVEAKVVSKGNTTTASREALSQLFEYSHFHYAQDGRQEPHLLALFSEDVVAYRPYLERHGIASVWQTPDGWRGSDRAAAWGIAARG
ncbi:MrcB family domain-containing protein [Streptomyces xiamenensis]|uniref:MrcB family domain-containing protein n=1 Tax=Streptomyces xiamenensis TaxID=408015 RepID=UPI003D75BB11